MIPWRYMARLAGAYVVVVVAIVLAISPYFSAGWDPQIFAGVGRSIIDNNAVFDLYQVSRQAWGDWGYPYPPLYAQLLAPAIGLSSLGALFPDWLMVRAAPIAFDLALAVLIYLVVMRRSNDERLARLGAALWLFNPLTLYQTAIQAHQESSWLACVVAAYALMSGGPAGASRGKMAQLAVLPSLLMACALALKQSAILFCIPYAVLLLLEPERRIQRIAIASALVAAVFGGLSLPYLLHSSDYVYLVVVAVSNMPVQTQSAVAWLLALKPFLIDQTRSAFFLLKYQAVITIALAALLSWYGLRRNRGLFRMGLLLALLFFLTSKKVMGYHYPMLAPFLLIYALPGRRFDLVALGMLAASWIVMSPYFAPWARPDHLALYAAIATPNTLLWLWLFVHVWRQGSAVRLGELNITERLRDGDAVVVALLVATMAMVLSCLAQPWAAASPLAAAILVVVVLLATLLLASPLARRAWHVTARVQPLHAALALLFVPLYFSAFALTIESTHLIETLLS